MTHKQVNFSWTFTYKSDQSTSYGIMSLSSTKSHTFLD